MQLMSSVVVDLVVGREDDDTPFNRFPSIARYSPPPPPACTHSTHSLLFFFPAQNVRARSAQFDALSAQLVKKFPTVVKDVRGWGLMRGIEIAER